LTGPQLSIDPVLAEKFVDNLARLRTKGMVAFADNALGRLPVAWRWCGQWGIAIVILQMIDLEQFAFEAIVTLHQLIMLFRGTHQRFHDLIRGLIGEI